jgi:hypothetical protein
MTEPIEPVTESIETEFIETGAIETEASTAVELAEVIAELEQYRDRLVNETMTTVQRAKLPKAAALARLEPELAQIDAALQNLREQQAALE